MSMSNDTREALAAKCKDLADTLYTGPVAHKAACVRLVHAAIDELAALTEQPAAPPVDPVSLAAELWAMSQGYGPMADALARIEARIRTAFTECSAGSKRDANNPVTALSIEMLVAAGHVSREKADEAYRLACDAMRDESARQGLGDPFASKATAAPQGVQAELPPGFVLVPKEPTAQMERAAFDELELLGTPTETGTSMRNRVYRAMLAAAPAAPAQEPQQPAKGERELIRETEGGGVVSDQPDGLPIVACEVTHPGGSQELFYAGWLTRASGRAVARLPRRELVYLSDAEAEIDRLRAELAAQAASSPAPAVQPTSEAVAELVEALRGVIRVADRATDEFDAARAAVTKYGRL